MLKARTSTFQLWSLILLAIAAALLVARGMQDMIESRGAVSHTRTVRLRLLELLSTSMASELDVRRHVLTGNPVDLDRVAAAAASEEEQLKDLRRLVSDNPTQTADAEKLETICGRIRELNATVIREATTHGVEAVQRSNTAAAERQAASERAALVQRMDAHELKLLETRQSDAEQSIMLFTGMLAGVWGLSVVVIVMGNRKIRLEVQARSRAENALRVINDNLEHRVRDRTAELQKTASSLAEREQEIRQINADLEERVRARTSELQAANAELEAFCYSVSHDLRAPLRAIDGFSRIVAADYGPKLDTEGKRLIEVVRSNTVRMGNLIDDLLAFSRLGRQATKLTVIDTTAMVKEIAAPVLATEEGRQIQFNVGDLPRCQGDHTMLRQVWTNLILNAFKFTRHRTDAKIDVYGAVVDGELQFNIRDNGVGFDMQYADKLFGVFQRFHRREEFEGTGVGLAIVKRVVERHGGTVGADAAVGAGARFWFTLPGTSTYANGSG